MDWAGQSAHNGTKVMKKEVREWQGRNPETNVPTLQSTSSKPGPRRRLLQGRLTGRQEGERDTQSQLQGRGERGGGRRA